jgi:dolichol-phosphate mannosyltransferase
VVLLPALNEEKGVGCVIDRIPRDRLRRAGYRVRVWVVDGKSTDATLEVARQRGASTFIQTGDGKGNGVRQLLDHLTAERQASATTPSRVFVMLDADGSYPPERIPDFVETLESGSADVVSGSRLLGDVEDGAITSFNLLGNRLLSRLATFLFGVPVSDVCTGMWGFREESLRHFGLAATGFDLEADVFASACEVGARLKEVPIEYSRRIGEAKLIPFRTGLLIAWRLLMKRLNRPEDARTRSPLQRALFAEEPA